MANYEQLRFLKQCIEAGREGKNDWNRWREENISIRPDLFKADLSGANLRRIDLGEANLEKANLVGTDLSNAILWHANLNGAILWEANLSGNFLDGANFEDASVGNTFIVNIDLSNVKGLESIRHAGPSEISISTLIHSKGKIPMEFLRGCGVPEPFIENIPALISAMKPVDFYSCFISYSSQDHSFAQKLYNDLQKAGVRCWFAPHHLPIGAKIRPSIDQSIYFHDKLLLILSCHSIKSQWVEQEVETALERERTEHRLILFPIRLDDEVMKIKTGWPLYLRNTRNIGDFTNQATYHPSFHRLLRDLREEK